MPPQRMSSLPHEDWVSSVSSRLSRSVHYYFNLEFLSEFLLFSHFLTASYDGQLRVFDYSQKLLRTVPLHDAPTTSLAIIPSDLAGFAENTHLIASASHDLTAHLTKLSLSDSSDLPSHQILASLHLHTAPLSSISANTSGKHLLTASWDGLIGLWDTLVPSSDEVPLEEPQGGERKKRRKLGDSENSKPKRKAPLNVLKSHTARVSRALFAPSGNQAYSTGFDSTIRTWDVENGVCLSTIVRFIFVSDWIAGLANFYFRRPLLRNLS